MAHLCLKSVGKISAGDGWIKHHWSSWLAARFWVTPTGLIWFGGVFPPIFWCGWHRGGNVYIMHGKNTSNRHFNTWNRWQVFSCSQVLVRRHKNNSPSQAPGTSVTNSLKHKFISRGTIHRWVPFLLTRSNYAWETCTWASFKYVQELAQDSFMGENLEQWFWVQEGEV